MWASSQAIANKPEVLIDIISVENGEYKLRSIGDEDAGFGEIKRQVTRRRLLTQTSQDR